MDTVNNIDIKTIIDDFYDNYKKNITNILNENNEYELSIDIQDYQINNVFLSTNRVKKITNFIEASVLGKANNSDGSTSKIKIRHRTDSILDYYRTNTQISNTITNNFELKTEIFTIKKDIYTISLAKEEKKNINKQDIINELNLYLIRSFSIEFPNFIVEIKEKKGFGKLTDNSTLLLHKTLISPDKKTIMYIEIELSNKKEKIKENIFKKNLSDIFSFIFQLNNINKLKLLNSKYKFPNNIKTLFKSHYETFTTINEMEYFITPKIDGISVYFNNKNYKCDIYLLGIYVINFESNIKNEITGYGEYFKFNKKRYIIPYFFTSDFSKSDIDIYERKILIDKYNNIDKKETGELLFVNKKIYGPFDSKEELCSSMLQIFEEIVYPIDGIIFTKIKGNFSTYDIKYKLDNTVDIIFVLNPLEIQHTENKSNYMLSTFVVKDDNRSMLVKKDNIFINADKIEEIEPISKYFKMDGKYFPNIFIGEYSFKDNTLIKIRIDKTNRLVKEQYYGNNLTIYNLSKTSHDNGFYFSIPIIKELADNFDIENIKPNLKLNNVYFKQNTTRGDLNYIINWFKSNIIYNTYVNIFNKIEKKFVVIDIGRFGESRKLFFINATEVIGSDPDFLALQEANNRYNNDNRNSKARMFKFTTFNKYVTDVDYIKTLESKILNISKNGTIKKPFGYNIDWQYAIHYSYQEKNKKIIFDVLKTIMGIDNFIIITCLDGTKILNEMEKENKKDLVYNIGNNEKYFISKISATEFNINVTSSFTDWKKEYIINLNELITDFKNNGFHLIDINYANMILRYINIFKNYNTFELKVNTGKQKFYSSTPDFFSLLNKVNFNNNDLIKILSYNAFLIFQRVA